MKNDLICSAGNRSTWFHNSSKQLFSSHSVLSNSFILVSFFVFRHCIWHSHARAYHQVALNWSFKDTCMRNLPYLIYWSKWWQNRFPINTGLERFSKGFLKVLPVHCFFIEQLDTRLFQQDSVYCKIGNQVCVCVKSIYLSLINLFYRHVNLSALKCWSNYLAKFV